MTPPISINIIIVSDSTALEQRILSVPAPNHFIPAVRTCRSSEVVYTDILIYDAASMPNEMPENIRCLECVLYAPPNQISPDLLHHPSWTGIWPQPLSDSMLEFYLRQTFLSAQSKKELALTKNFLNTLIDSVPDLIWFKDLRGSHMKVNDAFCRAVGKTKEQCEGRGHYYIWDLEPDEYAKGEYVCLETEEEVIRLNKTCLFEERVKSKNGLRQFKTYKSPLTNECGEMFGTVGIAKDVTDLQNIGQELEVILSSIPFAAMIADVDDSIISVNQKFCDYFNVTTDQILHMYYSDVCTKILNTTPVQLENERMTELRYHCDGNQYVFHAQQQAIHDIFGSHFGIFFLCLDVTNEFELQHKLFSSANTDFLTSLYNRRYFYDAIGQKTDIEQISFVCFDLDDFKKVNDTYGHQSGDNALILMAYLLRETFAQQLIARLGGDEFIVAFFGECIPAELEQDIKTFIEHSSAVFHNTKNMEILTLSAGIACNGTNQSVDTLLSCADKALYAAKALGKARYTVYAQPCND